MTEPDTLQVTFIGEREDIDEMIAGFEAAQSPVRVLSADSAEDPTFQKFGLIEYAAVATIVQLGFYSVELCTKLYDHLRRKGSPNRTIIVRTPFNSVTIEFSEDLTPGEVKRKLNAVLPALD